MQSPAADLLLGELARVFQPVADERTPERIVLDQPRHRVRRRLCITWPDQQRRPLATKRDYQSACPSDNLAVIDTSALQLDVSAAD